VPPSARQDYKINLCWEENGETAKINTASPGAVFERWCVRVAGSVDFTFDTQTINGTVITGLSSGAHTAQIQTYMNQVLAAAGCTGCSARIGQFDRRSRRPDVQ